MKLTRQLISDGLNPRNAYTLAQLDALGVSRPPRGWPAAGWPDRMVGKDVSEAQFAEFMRLGGMTAKEQRAERKARPRAKAQQPGLFEL